MSAEESASSKHTCNLEQPRPLPLVKNVILMCPAVNASALKSLEAIAHWLDCAGVGFHLSHVKGPVMDATKRPDFMQHFKGRMFLSQFEAFRTFPVGLLLNCSRPFKAPQKPLPAWKLTLPTYLTGYQADRRASKTCDQNGRRFFRHE